MMLLQKTTQKYIKWNSRFQKTEEIDSVPVRGSLQEKGSMCRFPSKNEIESPTEGSGGWEEKRSSPVRGLNKQVAFRKDVAEV